MLCVIFEGKNMTHLKQLPICQDRILSILLFASTFGHDVVMLGSWAEGKT